MAMDLLIAIKVHKYNYYYLQYIKDIKILLFLANSIDNCEISLKNVQI
jgi:hypothetical protein